MRQQPVLRKHRETGALALPGILEPENKKPRIRGASAFLCPQLLAEEFGNFDGLN
jgi:hypothetical protein